VWLAKGAPPGDVVDNSATKHGVDDNVESLIRTLADILKKLRCVQSREGRARRSRASAHASLQTAQHLIAANASGRKQWWKAGALGEST
jgi:hypothetical protein